MPFKPGQSGNPSGRPRKADQHAGAVARAERQIRDRLPSLIENMFKLADGVLVQATNEDSTTEVYARPPDRAANQYLIDRIMGKPTERREVDLNGELLFVKGYVTKEASPDAWDDDSPAE